MVVSQWWEMEPCDLLSEDFGGLFSFQVPTAREFPRQFVGNLLFEKFSQYIPSLGNKIQFLRNSKLTWIMYVLKV